MNEKEIKLKIGGVVHNKYHGTYNHFKKALAIKTIGKEAYDYVCNKVHPDLHRSHGLMFHCFMNNILENPKCVCGNNVRFNTSTRQFQKYCSNKCRFDNFSESIETRKKTCLNKYGSTNFLTSDAGKEKTIKTNMEKYGFKSHTQTEKYKASKIGVSQSPESIVKTKMGMLKRSYNSMLKKYSHCTPLFTLEEYTGVKGYIPYPWNCKQCGKDFISSCDNGSVPICNHCEPKGTIHEIVYKQLLDNLGVDYRFRYRELPSGKEIDVFVPDKMLGLEVCGLYWHSTANFRYAKPNHVSKTNECDDHGIKLLTIFDDEMYNPIKKRIVLNKIKSNLGKVTRKIYARNCVIEELPSGVCNKFLNKYHIQGSIGSSHRYGLLYRGRVVAIMTFNRGRTATGHKSKPDVWELGRYCTVFNFSIVGGASKLMTHFIKNVHPKEIYSYADRRWSGGNLYSKLGFQFVKNTTPNYWYTKTFRTREHRLKYQKHKLTHMASYSDDLTEEEIMRREKFFKIWDCGSKLYIWTPQLKNHNLKIK